VTILLDHGLRSRALGHGDQYTHEKDEIIRAARQERDDRKAALAIRLQEDQAIVASIIEQQIKESVMSRFS
jgi:ribosome-binding protein aMBF1 (putative translation factor)